MPGHRFLKEISAWSSDRLQAFMHKRYSMRVTGPANFCARSKPHEEPYAPFNHSDYPYRDKILSLAEEPWSSILDIPTEELIHPDPFIRSEHRDGYRLWDTTVGVPATDVRNEEPLTIAAVPAFRESNAHWPDVVRSFRRAGPLGTAGRLLRPNAKWLFDLTRMEGGWDILEAAHVLAHLRGDEKPDRRRFALGLTRTGGHYQAYVAEIVVSLAFDLPLDVSRRDEGRRGDPDFFYGLENKSSSRFRLPYLRVPWKGGEAPRFDETLAFICTGVFIEPHPYGYTDGTGNFTLTDRWCCQPTMVVIAGWETVDFVTHQPLAKSGSGPLNYIAHPADLLPPDLLWGYLALGYHRLGRPPVNERWQYFHDWIRSDAYMKLLRETPPLPCEQCLRINQAAIGAPKAPDGYPPSDFMKDDLWRAWYDHRGRIRRIVEKAVVQYETLHYGKDRAPAYSRRSRKNNYKAKLARLRDEALLEKAIEKVRKGIALTDKERTLFRAYERERQNSETRIRS